MNIIKVTAERRMFPRRSSNMSISNLLNQKLDQRKKGNDCTFNGYLEDYLNLADDLDPVLRKAFEGIFEKQADIKICVNLKGAISAQAISNQIIHYKDINKLSGKPIIYPYILYLTIGDEDKAMLVVPYSAYSQIIAKGLYFCMSEPGAEFIECKNEIVAVTADSAEAIVKAFEDFLTMKAGFLQRRLDGKLFKNYDLLKETCVRASQEMAEEAQRELPAMKDREARIASYVTGWFLLKKVLYVQYMMNKQVLKDVHEGIVKKQRNQAKLNADAIQFISYSELWRLKA